MYKESYKSGDVRATALSRPQKYKTAECPSSPKLNSWCRSCSRARNTGAERQHIGHFGAKRFCLQQMGLRILCISNTLSLRFLRLRCKASVRALKHMSWWRYPAQTAMACRKCIRCILTFNLSIHPNPESAAARRHDATVCGPCAFMCQPCTFHGVCWL